MDARHFDALSQALSAGPSRRRLLATLPLVSGLVAILDPADADGAGRRKRRKKAHKHGKGRRRKHHKKRCKAESVAQTCAGTCGTVINNCQKPVACGPCGCEPTCPACQICDETTRQCVADPSQQGDACGNPGQICQANGTCECEMSSCAVGQVCEEGECQCSPASCPDGCCDGAVCRGRDDAACGRGGGACVACAAPATCQQGVCSIYPTFGCTLQDDACTGAGNQFCPDIPPGSNFCLIAASGYPLCSPGGFQTTCTSDAQCLVPGFPVCMTAHGGCVTGCRAITTLPG